MRKGWVSEGLDPQIFSSLEDITSVRFFQIRFALARQGFCSGCQAAFIEWAWGSQAFHWGKTGMMLYSAVPVPRSPVSSTSKSQKAS